MGLVGRRNADASARQPRAFLFPCHLARIAKLRAARPTESYRRKPPIADDVLLRQLRLVLAREGKLSHRHVDEARDCASVQTYRLHFGGLRLAYALVGYEPSRYQDLQMEVRGQAISIEEARQIREAANSPQSWF